MPVAAAEAWIFGYGSLMWNPGFTFVEARRARLTGYHRAFCIYSVHYRGTERHPGLVLGLDRGGVCDGMAFRIAPENRDDVLAYLRRRELIYGVYREALVPIHLHHESAPPPLSSPSDGSRPCAMPPSAENARTVWATAYIAERAHPAYAGMLPPQRTASLIRRSAGHGGTNLDYFLSTLCHLETLGIAEPGLYRLLALTGAQAARRRTTDGSSHAPTSALTRAWAQRALASPRTVRDNRFGYRAKLG